ncbi:MAG: HupE/UreJ family protein [Schleiferiaceae bacterium]|nr:HupE/UreJ family protein [Schleiferiaceae bacterium]
MSVPTFAELGFFHILDVSAWDHLLFVAALIAPFAPRDFKLWLAALTAFTLGHTMAMAGQVAAKVPLNERLVEGAVLATLVLTAGRVVWFKGAPKMSRRGWLGPELAVAAAFGIIHGLAFAKDLGPLLPSDTGALWSAWGWFAGGIELGQLSVVSAVFAVRWMASARGFSPKDFALALGALTLGISLHLASQWYLV